MYSPDERTVLRKITQGVGVLQDEGVVSLLRAVGSLCSRQYRRRVRYRGATAEPYRLIRIDPREVEYLVSPNYDQQLSSRSTHVVGGNWDRNVTDDELMFYGPFEGAAEERRLVPLDNYCFYRSVEDHVLRGTPWTETEFADYLRSTDELPAGSYYASEETREWRFEQLDRLATSMVEEGYKTQRECDREQTVVSRDAHAGDVHRVDSLPPEHHEVMIDVGRDGELVFEEGRHRFAVARALGLERIPVRVFVRHAEWQEKRSEVARAGRPADVSAQTRRYLDHPDMTDVAAFDRDSADGEAPVTDGR